MKTLLELVSLENIRSTHRRFIELCLNAHEGQVFELFVTVGTQKHSIRTWFQRVAIELPGVWATNAVDVESDQSLKATIIVNPSILELEKTEQKEILSHNFVELIKTFLDGTRPKAVSRRLDLILFTATRKREGQLFRLFGDTPDYWDEIRVAVRSLLVSDLSLCESMEQLRTSREKIRDVMGKRPLEAQQTIDRLTHAFATTWHVSENLVRDRLYEYLITESE